MERHRLAGNASPVTGQAGQYVELAAIGARWHEGTDETAVAQLIAQDMVRLVDCADSAGLTVVGPDGGWLVAGSGAEPPAALMEALQTEIEDSPAAEAVQLRRQVVIHAAATETRWRQFCVVVAEHGVASMACLPLIVGDQVVGTLSLYAGDSDGFARERELVDALSTHAGLALHAATRCAQLTQAIATRDRIGQAKGILMALYDLDADAAFAVLRRCSAHTNVKLRQVAESVVASRELPASELRGARDRGETHLASVRSS